jgi:hypothetical protein
VIGSNFNFACYSNPHIDALLEQRLLEEAVSVPLVDEWSVWAVRQSVKGLKFNAFAYPVLSELFVEK